MITQSPQDKITRRQAWMKLAVLIADGLPEPKSIDFHPDGTILSIDFNTAEALAAWAAALELRINTPHQADDSDWIHSAYGKWHGYSISSHAYTPGDSKPEEITEDLAKVREIAEGSS